MDLKTLKICIRVLLIIKLCLLSVHGQCTDATRPLQINATYYPQYISSPNYPADYPLDSDCAWIITAPSPYDKIIINLEEVGAEGSSAPCKYDYVAVYDGVDATAPELARLCNINLDDENALVSSTDTFYVIFISDWAFNYVGFNMLIFSNNTDFQPDCDGNTTYVATNTPQVIMSPNLPDPYQSNFTCQMRFYAEISYFATEFMMFFMDIENTAGCTSDALRFLSVGEKSFVEAAAECSLAVTYEHANFPLEVAGSYVELNFTTDDSNNYLGFLIVYSQVFKGINLTSPNNSDTIEYSVPEDMSTGRVNDSVCVIVLTYTGFLNRTIITAYESTTDENITFDDTQLFDLTDSPPYVYLDLVSSLDYEVFSKFSLVVKMIDHDVTQVTYSVTFNITVTDVDDVAPVFGNLPANYTIFRGQKTGDLLLTVNATDGDVSPEFSTIVFQIFNGDTDSMFAINDTSGEVRLAQDANLIPLTTNSYGLTIAAYSGSVSSSALGSFSTFTVDVSPDSPPECSHATVWGETVDVNIARAGSIVQLIDTWNCSDDNNNLTYSIASVSPNLTTTLFSIDTDGLVTLTRQFNITEVVNRQFMLEIVVTDSVGQLETFLLYMNVTSLTCLPNPRNLYARMDQGNGTVLLDDFNCTNKYGLSYTTRQFPRGTFEVNGDVNGTVNIILRTTVVKIKFYSLTVTITDGVDIAVLRFKVIVQTKRCGLSGAVSPSIETLVWVALLLLHMAAVKM